MNAPQVADQFRDRSTIIAIARRERQSQHFALLIDHQMPLEAIKPAPTAFAALRSSGQDFL